jgi:hypothetical protein
MAIRLRTALVLIAWVLVSGVARADFQYGYTLQIAGTVNPRGTCVSGISLVPCTQIFDPFTNPFPELSIGGKATSLTVTYTAEDGPVTAVRKSRAEFAIAPEPQTFGEGLALLRFSLMSEGSLNVFDPQAGFGAIAHAFGVQFTVDIRDNVQVDIPSSLDGQEVTFGLKLPFTVSGNGSSWGRLSARFGDDTVSREFGNLNTLGGFWNFEEGLQIDFVRAANDPTRTFFVPFRLEGDFRSATLLDAAYIDSLDSLGLEATSSAEGLIFSSESGYLDKLLAADSANPIPEPQTYVLMTAGLLMLIGWSRTNRWGLRRVELRSATPFAAATRVPVDSGLLSG